MSFVTTEPEILAAAASTLQSIGETMGAYDAASAAPTIDVVPPAADEVSALTAAQLSAYARIYQAVSAQARAMHAQFAVTLQDGAGSYAAAEFTNAAASS